MAFIYKITNLINQKVYIGKTETSVAHRFQQHLQESTKSRSQYRPLYRAMNKYGIENFVVETLEETSNPIEREIYYIAKYHSYIGDEQCNGYNATIGGDGRPYEFTVDEIQTIITMFNQRFPIEQIARTIGHDRATVTNKLIQLGFTIDKSRSLRMAVYQIDKTTNQILNCYSSTHEAARTVFNDNAKNTHIGECCRGLRKTAYGYKWQFVEDYENND